MEDDKVEDLVCVLCGRPWVPGCKNVCECGGFSTWGKVKDGPPSSWDVHPDGTWTPKPVPKDHQPPAGRRLSGWTKLRLWVQYMVLLGLLVWQPFWFMVGYCALAYLFTIYAFASGQLVSGGKTLAKRIVGTVLTILLAPLFFTFFLIMCAMGPII